MGDYNINTEGTHVYVPNTSGKNWDTHGEVPPWIIVRK